MCILQTAVVWCGCFVEKDENVDVVPDWMVDDWPCPNIQSKVTISNHLNPHDLPLAKKQIDRKHAFLVGFSNYKTKYAHHPHSI